MPLRLLQSIVVRCHAIIRLRYICFSYIAAIFNTPSATLMLLIGMPLNITPRFSYYATPLRRYITAERHAIDG